MVETDSSSELVGVVKLAGIAGVGAFTCLSSADELSTVGFRFLIPLACSDILQ